MSGNQSGLMGGDRPPVSIVNLFSSGGGVPPIVWAFINVKSTLSGALTANTLKTMLNISGAGVLKFAGVYSADTTSRTLRLKITLDGVVVFDATSAATTASNAMQVGVGNIVPYNYATPNYVPVLDRVVFNSSCLVEIASSLSETDKIGLAYAYETR